MSKLSLNFEVIKILILKTIAIKKTIFSKLFLVIFFIGGVSTTAQVRVKTNRGNNKKKVVVKTNRHNNHNNHNHVIVIVNPIRNRAVVSKPNRTRVIINRPTYNRSGYVWVEGYWKWNVFYAEYTWQKARWKRIKRNYYWVPGFWEIFPNGFFWIEGYW